MIMKKCDNCGLNIDDDMTQCPYCGRKVEIKPKENPKQEEDSIREIKNNVNHYHDPILDEYPFNKNQKEGSSVGENNQKASYWWFVLGLFFPIIAFIFGIIYARKNINIYRLCIKGAMLGIFLTMLIDIALTIIFYVLFLNGYLDQYVIQETLIVFFNFAPILF